MKGANSHRGVIIILSSSVYGYNMNNRETYVRRRREREREKGRKTSKEGKRE